jgi:choline dehydrogenase-like flavoprotein
MATNTFDAIVIGSGISGGWAAKEFTGKGFKTLVLERGRDVKHLKDYPTTNMLPWEFEHRGQIPAAVQEANPVISRCYAFKEDAAHFFVKDTEHPYIQEKPFDWIRGYQVGGKSIMWARQTQRWSDFDFEGPGRDGFAVDWPIRYKDLAPWYSYVEKFAGISGNKDGLPELPDGEFLPPLELNCVENHFKDAVSKNYKGRHVIYGRCAHVTEPQPIHIEQGRGKCQNRNLCQRGCPFGGYFNSNSTTLPWADKTGNLTLRTNAVVQAVIYDDKKGKATGVRIIDAVTKEVTEFYAPVIFVNAAALNTNLLLLNSTSSRFPNGLGNDSGLLGKYLAFHNYSARISGQHNGHLDSSTDGRSPTSAYLPRFRNVYKQETDFLRGYAAGFSAGRYTKRNTDGFGIGAEETISFFRTRPLEREFAHDGRNHPKRKQHGKS